MEGKMSKVRKTRVSTFPSVTNHTPNFTPDLAANPVANALFKNALSGPVRPRSRRVLAFSTTLSSLALIMGCQKPQSLQSIQWKSQNGKKIPREFQDLISNDEFRFPQVTVPIQDEVLERTSQHVGPAIVEGSYVQQIRNPQGEVLFLKAEVETTSLMPYEAAAKKYFARRFLFLEKVRGGRSELRDLHILGEPRLKLRAKNGHYEFNYVLEALDTSGLSAYELYFSCEDDFSLLEKVRVGSAFADGHAEVFPLGPKMSALSAVSLHDLIGDGTLTNSRITLSSQSSEQAFSVDQNFNYAPEDQRFDQVQAFYYVDQALAWFTNHLGVTVPFPLDVQVQVGEPQEKTNTAFYYHGHIRLGSGDGRTYRDLLKDPTVVMHETGHAVVDTVGGLPFEGEGGSLNEGFADFFAAAILNHPRLGELSYLQGPYRRSVENSVGFKEKNGSVYHDSAIVSGTLWDLRQALGEESAYDLAVRTLARLGPSAQLHDVRAAVQASWGHLSPVEIESIGKILDARGWP
jgi:hypothetical protein